MGQGEFIIISQKQALTRGENQPFELYLSNQWFYSLKKKKTVTNDSQKFMQKNVCNTIFFFLNFHSTYSQFIRKAEKERERIFHPLFHPLYTCLQQGLRQAETRSQNNPVLSCGRQRSTDNSRLPHESSPAGSPGVY